MEIANTVAKKTAADRHLIMKTAIQIGGRTRAKGTAKTTGERDPANAAAMEAGIETGTGTVVEILAGIEKTRVATIAVTEKRMTPAESADEAEAEVQNEERRAAVAMIAEIAALIEAGGVLLYAIFCRGYRYRFWQTKCLS